MEKTEKDRQLGTAKQQLKRSAKLEPIKNRFEAVLKAKIVGQPTPPNVLKALDIIRDYLASGDWVQAIINVEGGVSFRLSDIHEDFIQQLKSDDQRSQK